MRFFKTKAVCIGPIVWTMWTLLIFIGDAMGERLPIRTYTTADGLARDHVSRIVQDSRGFMWFCTSEALSRFDGYKFTIYGSEQGLAGRQVTDFLETRAGVYWVATDKGLCRFIPDALPQKTGPGLQNRFDVFYPGDGPAAQSIDSIYEDHAGAIWCCTQAGLYRFDQNGSGPAFSMVDIIQPASWADNRLRVESVVEDRKGSLWIVAQSGLYRLWPGGAVDRYTDEEGLPSELSRAVFEDLDGRIWVASDRGLFQLVSDPHPHRSIVAHLYTIKDGLASNKVFCLSQSSDGTLWIGTSRGLTALQPMAGNEERRRLRTYTEANGLNSSAIAALCEDRAHNLWVGTDSGGAMKLAATGFVSYDERDGLGNTRRVGSIIEDRAGHLCVITDDTISRLDGERLSAFPLRLPSGVFSWGWGWYQIMFQDSKGEWWLTSDQGLVRYPKLTLEQVRKARPKAIYKERDGLPSAAIFRLFEDSRGDVWISTLGNPKAVLTRWDRNTEAFNTYHPADGIPEAAPTAFREDAAGNLWIGLYDNGLVRYRDGHFTHFTKADGVPPGMIRAIYLDHAQRLWIATGEGGVARVDQPAAEHPNFVSYSAAEGLSSSQANCVTEDNWGMIYVGTGRGLDKLDPATGRIRHYSTADGLAGSFVNVSFRRADGSLWFGTLQGLSRLIPQAEPATAPLPVFVTALNVAGVPYPVPELGALSVAGPVLGPTQNNVQIDFCGLNLTAGESLRYQYELEGASSEWSAPSDQRSISYPNLAPGSYRFLVRAIGSDGAVSESPASVTFRILAPFWRRWWFITLAMVASALCLYGIHRYRMGRILELERVRTRIATDLHDDIGSSLSQVSVLSEVASQRARASLDPSEPLSLIADLSRDVLDSVSDIVWAINPERDRLSDLTLRMRRFAGDTASAANIKMDFSAEGERADVRLGPDLRREVYLIFKEGLNNMMRHSGCGRAEVTIKTLDGSLELTITDDGGGFDPDRASDGNGLVSMRQRAARLGGLFEIRSEPGSGTILKLLVPLGRNSSVPRR